MQTDSNGLYYMRARYYSPDLKRFINRDIVFGGFLGEKASNVFKITMHAASGIKSYNEGYYDDFIQEYKIVQSNLEELKNINVNSFNPFKKVKPLKLDLQFFASKGTGKSLLPGEGKVGTYEELIDAGSRGDNLTPHHMNSHIPVKEEDTVKLKPME